MKKSMIGVFVLLASIGPAGSQQGASPEPLLIDDFSGELSALGTVWEGFTDRVMGGVSDIDVRLEPEEGGTALHMSGRVSLENRGGFIQVRIFLRPDKGPFDAGAYRGIELRVRGRGDGYYMHLRTPRTVFPWAFYGQRIPVREDWSVIRLPFEEFRSENMIASVLNPRRLVTIGIAAAKQEFLADLYVDSVAFYR